MLKSQLREFKVDKKNVSKRADVFIAEKFPEFTRSSLSGLFDKNLVLVNGKPAKASYKLRMNDELSVDTDLLTARPADIELPVIYEDDDVIVINKPAGILTHSKGALNTEATVASFIKPLLTDKNLIGNRAGIVHRLDRATSGVIIAAKNEKTLKWLQKQFSSRKVKKTYLAIVEGVPDPDQAIIDAPIERNPKKPQTFRVGGSGRQAVTNYKLLKILNAFDSAKPHSALTMSERSKDRGVKLVNKSSSLYSLLELAPQTGRTHQLRVHLKYIGRPIVGDHIYGRDGENMYLYAKSLEITLPGGHRKKFEAPEPKIFKDFK